MLPKSGTRVAEFQYTGSSHALVVIASCLLHCVHAKQLGRPQRTLSGTVPWSLTIYFCLQNQVGMNNNTRLYFLILYYYFILFNLVLLFILTMLVMVSLFLCYHSGHSLQKMRRFAKQSVSYSARVVKFWLRNKKKCAPCLVRVLTLILHGWCSIGTASIDAKSGSRT
jgi:hypothetical protein